MRSNPMTKHEARERFESHLDWRIKKFKETDLNESIERAVLNLQTSFAIDVDEWPERLLEEISLFLTEQNFSLKHYISANNKHCLQVSW